MKLIQISHLTKSYPDGEKNRLEVLRSLSFDVDQGEFVAITGASGSGKTTLLSIMGLLLAPDSGRYLLNNEDMLADGLQRHDIRHRVMGFIFQDHRLLPQYTVLDNILLPTLANQPKATAEQKELAHRLMDLTGIAGLDMKVPAMLSGGEAGRVALCRALIMQPLLLLADEPTGQLDTVNARRIVDLLHLINQSMGTTIVMVTHAPEVAAEAQRIVHLSNGVLTE